MHDTEPQNVHKSLATYVTEASVLWVLVPVLVESWGGLLQEGHLA